MLHHLEEPIFLIDRHKVKQNINSVLSKLDEEITFTPHFKTHQSHQIGRMYRELGISGIKVSSLKMASYFADDGWNDVTVAFPFHKGMIQRVNVLADKCNISVFVNNMEACNALLEKVSQPVSVYIEIDSGYGRSGVSHHHRSKIDALVSKITSSSWLHFKGFYTHAGDSYESRTKDEIMYYHERTEAAFRSLKEKYKSRYPQLRLCSGDTPTASIVEKFGVINEISAGNLVYYDLVQAQIGSCRVDDIAVALAAPVAEVKPGKKQVIVHGGAVHLSKDALEHKQYGTIFGLPVFLNTDNQNKINGWSRPLNNSFVISLSQEHGILQIDEEYINKLEMGSPIGILPVHSCLTANLMHNRKQLIGQ